MLQLPCKKIANQVDKYLITEFIISEILVSCDDLIMQHNVKLFTPYKSFCDTLHLTKNLLSALYIPTPLEDIVSQDAEPGIVLKDTHQSAIKIDLIFPEVQQQFLTSITRFNRKSSIKSSMKSSVRSFSKTSMNKQEKQQQPQQGQLHINFTPLPLVNMDEQNDQDQFYREAYEMKKKQEQLIKLNKITKEQQKQQIKQQLSDLKKKHNKSSLTYDEDGSILVMKGKISEHNHQIRPEIKVHCNEKDKQISLKKQVLTANIINSSISKQQKNTKVNNSCEVRMKTEPVRVNSTYQQRDLQNLSSKQKIHFLLHDQTLKLTKQQFQQMIDCENNLGEILQQKINRFTQLQLQRTQYIQQYNQSRSITPLMNQEFSDNEKSKCSLKKQEGKINLNNLTLIESISDEINQDYTKSISNPPKLQLHTLKLPKNSKINKPNIQFKLVENSLPILTQKTQGLQKVEVKTSSFSNEKSKLAKIRSQTTHG